MRAVRRGNPTRVRFATLGEPEPPGTTASIALAELADRVLHAARVVAAPAADLDTFTQACRQQRASAARSTIAAVSPHGAGASATARRGAATSRPRKRRADRDERALWRPPLPNPLAASSSGAPCSPPRYRSRRPRPASCSTSAHTSRAMLSRRTRPWPVGRRAWCSVRLLPRRPRTR